MSDPQYPIGKFVEDPDVTPEKRNHCIADLEAALRATSAEVTALRASMSWRMTGPLRAIYDVWLRWRGTE